MKNRKREICTSGSVRDEDGQPPHLLGHRRNVLHLAAGAAAVPTLKWRALAPSTSVRKLPPKRPVSAQRFTSPRAAPSSARPIRRPARKLCRRARYALCLHNTRDRDVAA